MTYLENPTRMKSWILALVLKVEVFGYQILSTLTIVSHCSYSSIKLLQWCYKQDCVEHSFFGVCGVLGCLSDMIENIYLISLKNNFDGLYFLSVLHCRGKLGLVDFLEGGVGNSFECVRYARELILVIFFRLWWN